MATDPVCGMQVDERSAAHKSEHQGKTHYFCSSNCKTQFDQNPQRYASGQQQQGQQGQGQQRGQQSPQQQPPQQERGQQQQRGEGQRKTGTS